MKYLLLCLAIPMLLSCEEVMDVSFTGNSARTLVVDGVISTDTMPHIVVLSYTGDFFAPPEQPMATGAEVTISDGDTTFLLHELSDGEYFTETNVYGEVGKTYTLHVKLDDGKEYTASDKLLPCGEIDSIEQSQNYNSYINGYGYDVLFYGKEPEPIGNNYLYLLYVNNVLYSDTISEITFANDEFVNGQYIRDLIVYRVREKDIKGIASKVTLEMYSITRDYYDFLSALMLETVWKGSPWDGPPASVTGNVSNGGKGYFRACQVRRYSKFFASTPRVN